jgi:hypothetical protein
MVGLTKKGETRMTYKEFREKYPFASKKWRVDGLLAYWSDLVIKATKTEQKKMGTTNWHTTRCEADDVSVEFYLNAIEAVPFFRGIGGYERVECDYTRYGYVPVKVYSVSPDKQDRKIYEFKFE